MFKISRFKVLVELYHNLMNVKRCFGCEELVIVQFFFDDYSNGNVIRKWSMNDIMKATSKEENKKLTHLYS